MDIPNSPRFSSCLPFLVEMVGGPGLGNFPRRLSSVSSHYYPPSSFRKHILQFQVLCLTKNSREKQNFKLYHNFGIQKLFRLTKFEACL